MTVAPTSANTPCWGSISDLDPSALAKIGQMLLDRVIAIYEEAGVELPLRRVWAAGDIPFECNSLVVSLAELREGIVNSETAVPDPCHVPLMAEFNITAARCYPVGDQRGNPPSPEKIAAAAIAAATDAYLLMKASCTLDMFGADIPGAPQGGMGVEASISIGNPQGGMQTVTLNLVTMI